MLLKNRKKSLKIRDIPTYGIIHKEYIIHVQIN